MPLLGVLAHQLWIGVLDGVDGAVNAIRCCIANQADVAPHLPFSSQGGISDSEGVEKQKSHLGSVEKFKKKLDCVNETAPYDEEFDALCLQLFCEYFHCSVNIWSVSDLNKEDVSPGFQATYTHANPGDKTILDALSYKAYNILRVKTHEQAVGSVSVQYIGLSPNQLVLPSTKLVCASTTVEEQKKSKVQILVDTNVFMHFTDLVWDLRVPPDGHIGALLDIQDHITIIRPYAVSREVDHINHSKSHTASQKKCARDGCKAWEKLTGRVSNREVVMDQDYNHFARIEQQVKGISNPNERTDMHIIKYAQDLQSKGYMVSILTADTELRGKAHGQTPPLKTCDAKTLSKCLYEGSPKSPNPFAHDVDNNPNLVFKILGHPSGNSAPNKRETMQRPNGEKGSKRKHDGSQEALSRRNRRKSVP